MPPARSSLIHHIGNKQQCLTTFDWVQRQHAALTAAQIILEHLPCTEDPEEASMSGTYAVEIWQTQELMFDMWSAEQIKDAWEALAMRLRALRNSLHSEGIHCSNPTLSRAVHEVSVDVGMRAGRSEEWHKALTILSRNVLPRLCKVRLLTPVSSQSGICGAADGLQAVSQPVTVADMRAAAACLSPTHGEAQVPANMPGHHWQGLLRWRIWHL